MSTDAEVLAEIDAAFGTVARPEHFTNFSHCCECAEHDAVLRSRTRETLRLEDIGNPAWDPLCFTISQGIAYYFPALAQFALAPPVDGYGWYADHLLFHLYSGFRDNGFYQYCSRAQRAAVARFLAHLLESRAAFVDAYGVADDFLRCYELWNDS